jgi:hypothetical protein
MKKTQRLLALLLALILCMACLAACDDKKSSSDDDEGTKNSETTAATASPEQLIVGEWKTTLKMGKALFENMEAENGENFAKYFKDLKFNPVICMKFTEDKKASIYCDETTLDAAVDECINSFKDAFKAMLTDQYGDNLNATLAAEGYTSLDAYVNDMVTKLGITSDALTDEMREGGNGTYTIEGNTLTVVPDNEETPNQVYTFSVTENALNLNMSDAEKAKFEGNPAIDLLPFVLTRK